MDFERFGLNKDILHVLEKINFSKATSIQNKIIPLLSKNQNVIALSHTGTGKTHAFLLPIFNKIDVKKRTVQAIIVVPTRELAKQIYQNCLPFVKYEDKNAINLCIGNLDQQEIKKLEKNTPAIVIGTPKRLREIYDQKIVALTTANILIIDEVDMIFEFGFIEDLDYLLNKMTKKLQLGFFSATINEQLQHYLKKYSLNGAVIVDDTQKNIIKNSIKHYLVDTKNRELDYALSVIVNSLNPYLCLIFVNKRQQISQIVKILRKMGNKVGELHGSLDLQTRDSMIKRIRINEFKYVVVSDIAARGLDIEAVSDIISVNLPHNLNYYIHRAGRTARNNLTGNSYILNSQENKNKIEKLKQMGINFYKLKVVDDKMVEEKQKINHKKVVNDHEIQMIISRYKNEKPKPGYKKKRKNEIEKLQNNRRRQHIKESIEKNKKEKYKKRRDNIFDN